MSLCPACFLASSILAMRLRGPRWSCVLDACCCFVGGCAVKECCCFCFLLECRACVVRAGFRCYRRSCSQSSVYLTKFLVCLFTYYHLRNIGCHRDAAFMCISTYDIVVVKRAVVCTCVTAIMEHRVLKVCRLYTRYLYGTLAFMIGKIDNHPVSLVVAFSCSTEL